MAQKVMRFKNMTVGRQQGELARFRVLGGPDSGVVFILTAPLVTIGRGEDNDIILADIKSSRKHAEVSISGGMAMIKDVGSSHGFLVNGVMQKQVQLKNGDKVGIGATVMEYIGAAANVGATQMLVRPPVQTSRAVGTTNSKSGLTQFITRPGAATSSADALGMKSGKPVQQQTFFEKNKTMVVALALLMAISGGVQQVDQKRTIASSKSYISPLEQNSAKEPSVLAQEDTDSPAFKSSNIYYQLGMRELNARNYLRAMTSFETALQIYGGHKLASVYLKTTKKKMEDDATDHFKTAKSDESANRIRGALNHMNAVKRMFAADQSNKNYKEAEAKLIELEKRLKEMEKP